MIIHLSETELLKAQISFQPPTQMSSRYLIERENVWSEHIRKAYKSGKNIWNGIIYTINDWIQIDEENLLIKLSSCEFKDIVFRNYKGVTYVLNNYGIDSMSKFITLDCIPVTNDGKYVFGIRGNTTNVKNGSIGLIGGTANKDEMEITSTVDFKKFMIKEIEEETQITVNEHNLSLFSINQFNGKFEFLYKLVLNLNSCEIDKIFRKGEFVDILCLSEQEVFNYKGKTLDAFRYSKLYINSLNRK
ncbi:MAG: hypothetical protein L3J74_00215 [Bacteroidales bacterium]|nr:hypothetical protein [Bacteroidales bacterium]